LRDGLIIPVKKGLYIAGPALNSGKPEPFLLANHILGPSYISLETALAYHGFIPERVYELHP
jgi:predicted transcriptional regulator of viral defense system